MSICSVFKENSRRGISSTAIHQSSRSSPGQGDPRICPCNVCTYQRLHRRQRRSQAHGTLHLTVDVLLFMFFLSPLKVLFSQTLRQVFLCLPFTDAERSQGHTANNQSDRESDLRLGLSICTAFGKQNSLLY